MKIYRLVRVVFWMGITVLLTRPTAAFSQGDPEAVETDQCVVCHTDLEILPQGFTEDDVHRKVGLTCAGCHGGDPTSDDDEVAMSPEAGFVGVPAKKKIPEFCGKCHSDIDFMRTYRPRIPTDQVKQYRTSVHGILLAQGDEKVADCASCHTAHAVFSAKDKRSTVHAMNVPFTCKHCHSDPIYMKPYDIPTNQFDGYYRSVHGVALLEKEDTGAPACNDCHGNHGATLPGAASVAQICGSCHVNNMRYFFATKMGKRFAELELHGCEECHGNHNIHKASDDMVGIERQAVCLNCHDAGDKGYVSAGEIHGHLKALVTRYDQAKSKQDEIHRKGIDDEEVGFLLQEAHQSLIQARTLVHTYDPEKVRPKVEEGVSKASAALDLSLEGLREYRVRRYGFGMATLFITLLVVALFLKIRQLGDS